MANEPLYALGTDSFVHIVSVNPMIALCGWTQFNPYGYQPESGDRLCPRCGELVKTLNPPAVRYSTLEEALSASNAEYEAELKADLNPADFTIEHTSIVLSELQQYKPPSTVFDPAQFKGLISELDTLVITLKSAIERLDDIYHNANPNTHEGRSAISKCRSDVYEKEHELGQWSYRHAHTIRAGLSSITTGGSHDD